MGHGRRQEIVAHQVHPGNALEYLVKGGRFLEELVGAAAADHGALPVRGDGGEDQAGQGLLGLLHEGDVHSLPAEDFQSKIAEPITPGAPQQASRMAPAGQRQGSVGAHAAAMELQLRRQAIAPQQRGCVQATDDVYVDVAENYDFRHDLPVQLLFALSASSLCHFDGKRYQELTVERRPRREEAGRRRVGARETPFL